ncbi:MAG: DUF1540 domain-containing protein [Oscillospiraceae bacterium]|nr:DUF1540 domain-containing protein [Oscillospiraceae bacterium]
MNDQSNNSKSKQHSHEHDHSNIINCDVTNCYYHGSANCCHAKSINVGPNYAISESDTVCSTFKNK